MPIEIEYEPNEICVLRIRGVLKQSEFAAKQKALADKIDVGRRFAIDPFFVIGFAVALANLFGCAAFRIHHDLVVHAHQNSVILDCVLYLWRDSF